MATATNGNGQATNAEQIAILSELVNRMQFARRHGLSYDDARDLYKVGGYPRELTFDAYSSLYLRDPLAGQIVDMAAETTWRSPPEVVEPGEKETTAFTDAFYGLVNRLGLWQRFERADRLSRIGRYSVLLIGTAGTDSDLAKPLGKIAKPEDVLYLAGYSEKHAPIDSWVTNPADPRYGLPETYKIDMSTGVATFKPVGTLGGSRIVHHSRLIHIAEGLLEDEVYGRPALQRIYNDLSDLQKVSTSTAEAFWQRVAGILTATVDKEMQGVDDAFYTRLDDHLKEIYHDLRKTFYGQGVELSRLAESEPNPEAAADLFMTRIAAGAGYPKRILFGSETGERASSEDQKTFLGSIAERQRQHAEPAILRPFIDKLIDLGALPRPGQDGYEVIWPTLFQVPDREVAEANRIRAEAAKALTPIGGNPLDLVEISDERDVWLRPTGDREPIDPEAMAEEAEERRQEEADRAAERLRESTEGEP